MSVRTGCGEREALFVLLGQIRFSEVGHLAGRHEGEQGEGSEEHQRGAQGSETGVFVDLDGRVRLRRGRTLLLEDRHHLITGHELDVVEVDLLDEFGRERRRVQCVLRNDHTEERDRDGRTERDPDRAGDVVGEAAERSDIAGEFLRVRHQQLVEDEGDDAALGEAEGHQSDDHRHLAPVVADREREQGQGEEHEDERHPRDRCRAEPVVQARHLRVGHEDRQRVGHDRQRGLKPAESLNDLHVQRQEEAGRGADEEHQRHAGDDRALTRRPQHVEGEEHRPAVVHPSSRRSEEGVDQHDTDDQQQGHGGHPRDVERGLLGGPEEPPGVEEAERGRHEDDADRRERGAAPVDLDLGVRVDRSEAADEEEVDDADHGQQHERPAPAHARRQRAGDQQRGHLGQGNRRGEETDRLALLLAVVAAGDHDSERWSGECHRRSVERLDGEQHPSLIGERDRDRCNRRPDHADVERSARPDLGADARAEQHEPGHGEGARGQGEPDRRRRNAEVLHDPLDRHVERIERHLDLAHHHDRERKPGGLRDVSWRCGARHSLIMVQICEAFDTVVDICRVRS